MDKMKILMAASEAIPYMKTGGLADVVGSLPKYFDKDRYDVRVILPKYKCMDDKLHTTIYTRMWRSLLSFQRRCLRLCRL